MEFKTYNDKDYEKDAFCRIFEKILLLIICPALILFIPFMIIDSINKKYFADSIILSIVFLICLVGIIYLVTLN